MATLRPVHYPYGVRTVAITTVLLVGCIETAEEPMLTRHGEALDPNTAPHAVVDRFANVRTAESSLPEPDVPIDFDDGWLRWGLGPEGDAVAYYDFGLATGFTMPAYRLVDEEGTAIEGQLLIIGAMPGAEGYSDFWQLTDVEVPLGYIPNSITSVTEIMESGYPLTLRIETLNRPVVPEGSTAQRAREDGRLYPAWVDDEIALSFDFVEAEVSVRGDLVNYLPIYVCLTEDGIVCTDDEGLTHNVIPADPSSPDYTPLWKPAPYPESVFDDVVDLESARAVSPQKLPMLVNCPIVEW